MTGAPLDDLVARFLEGTLPKLEWTHAAHLSVGAWHVHTFGLEQAVQRLRTGIRALNDRHGTANTASSGFHETTTVAYARLIDEFLSACDVRVPFELQVQQLLAGPLGDRALLLRFWTKEVLMSPAARAAFAPPDLRPLALPADALSPRT